MGQGMSQGWGARRWGLGNVCGGVRARVRKARPVCVCRWWQARQELQGGEGCNGRQAGGKVRWQGHGVWHRWWQAGRQWGQHMEAGTHRQVVWGKGGGKGGRCVAGGRWQAGLEEAAKTIPTKPSVQKPNHVRKTTNEPAHTTPLEYKEIGSTEIGTFKRREEGVTHWWQAWRDRKRGGVGSGGFSFKVFLFLLLQNAWGPCPVARQ